MASPSVGNLGTPLSSYEYYIMGLVLTAEGVLGILLNGILLIVILTNQPSSRRRPQFLLAISLCIADLGIGLMCPFAALASFKEYWLYGDQGCQLYASVGMLFGTVSITSLVSIAVDKYYSAVGITGGGKVYPIAVSAIWLNAIFWAVTPLSLIGWGRYALEPQKTTCMLDFASHDAPYVSYLVAMMCVVYVVPMGVVSWCLLQLREGGRAEESKKISAQKEAAKTCVAVLLSLVLYWGAYGVVALWAAADDINNVPLRLVAAAPLLAKICPIGNAVLQVLTNQSLQSFHGEEPRTADKKK